MNHFDNLNQQDEKVKYISMAHQIELQSNILYSATQQNLFILFNHGLQYYSMSVSTSKPSHSTHQLAHKMGQDKWNEGFL